MMENTIGEALKVGKFIYKVKEIHFKVHEAFKKSQENSKYWND